MKKTLISIIFIGMLAVAGVANAMPITTTDGVIASTPGTATYYEVGSYVSGGTGLTGYGNSWPADAGDGASVYQEASNVDRYWLQYSTGTSQIETNAIVWDFTGATDSILAISGIDHAPLPYEALEFILWGWTGASWEEGVITAIYDDGVDAAWGYDDYSSVWNFSSDYTRFRATGGTHLVGYSGTEGEIDAIASMTTSVPEPGTLLVLGFGLVGLVLVGLRKKSEIITP